MASANLTVIYTGKKIYILNHKIYFLYFFHTFRQFFTVNKQSLTETISPRKCHIYSNKKKIKHLLIGQTNPNRNEKFLRKLIPS